MATKVGKRIKGALAQVKAAGGDGGEGRTKGVDGALGGDDDGDGDGGGEPPRRAPGVVKGINYWVSKAPALLKRKNLPQVLGIGEIPLEGATPAGCFPSVNLGLKTHVLDDEVRAKLLEVKKEVHNAFLQQQIFVHLRHMPLNVIDTPYFKNVVAPMLKAFDLSGFSAWVPTLNTAFYFEEFEIDPGLEKFFSTYPMPSRTVTVPGAIARLKGQLYADSSTFTAQYNTSTSYQMTAQDNVVHTDITEDLMQDMVPNSGGFDRLRREVAMGIRRSREDALLNGDDTISSSVQGDGHMDSDIAGGAATLFQKAFKGLRKRAIAAGQTYDNGGQGLSLGTFNGLISALGKFAVDKADLLIVIGPTAANKEITGNVPEILPIHNVGAQATLVTGQLPKLFGIEQYESEWVREDLAATGVYAATSAYATVTIVKKSRFVIGERAPMRIWATPSLASSDKLLLSAKERMTFGGVPQGTGGEKSVAVAIGVSGN